MVLVNLPRFTIGFPNSYQWHDCAGEYLQVYQEFFYIYPPVKVMADFPALQDKTGTPDLKRCLHACMAASVYVKSNYKLHVHLLYSNCFSQIIKQILLASEVHGSQI